MEIKKADFCRQLHEKYGYTMKASKELTDSFIQVLQDNMKEGNRVTFNGFGCFEVKERESRNFRDLRTRQMMVSAPSRVVKFYPGSRLRDLVRKGAPVEENTEEAEELS